MIAHTLPTDRIAAEQRIRPTNLKYNAEGKKSKKLLVYSYLHETICEQHGFVEPATSHAL